ncbi:MAG: molybdate ABC transporter substrate-binding protein [Dehalococcoidia bacterium]
MTPLISHLLLAPLLCLLLLAACDGDGVGETDEAADGGDAFRIEGDLTVFAAASLTDAFGEMGSVLEANNPELDIEFNFASSNSLLTQIQEGAPADVYAAAAPNPVDTAVEEGLVTTPEVFALNVPVIVVPADNPAGIESPADLANGGVKLVLAAEDVPIGTYSRQVITNLSQDPEYGDDYDDAVLDNVVSNESDVRAVLAKVELGEADAGIVYISDAAVSGDKVRTIEFPEESNVIAEYPIAVVEDGDNGEAAAAFVEFVLSDVGQAILVEYGFQPAS